MHPQQLAVAVVMVVLFAGASAVAEAAWALTAGEAACPVLQHCADSYSACTAYAAGSYIEGADSPPFVNATSPQRQLAAAPFRFEGEGSFEVKGLSMIFSRAENDDAVFNVTVFFYEANITDPSLPGAVLPEWEGGRAVRVTRGALVSPSGGTITAPFYRVTGPITPSFNLSEGTYFLSVASFGSKPSTTGGAYRIAGSNTTGTYFAAYLGIRPRGTIYPAFFLDATDAWTVPTGAKNVSACVWPTGTVHRPQGGNTTNTTTTTTAGITTTTTTGNTTTTGGSGGGSNPTDYLVRYPLATDLNSLSPAGFIYGVSATLQLPPDAQIEIVAARRAQVTTSSGGSGKRAEEQGTLLDFFVSGTDGASFMEKALSAQLADLRANNVSIASPPSTVTADASSGALLRPAALVSLVVVVLLLFAW